MPASLIDGYVMHRIPYRETSYLVDVFSADTGVFRGVAKGVRGSKTDRKSLLQPFQRLTFSVTGRHELKSIGRVEPNASRVNLVHKGLFCALYVNEIIARVVPAGLPCEAVFSIYEATLAELASCDVSDDMREFERVLRSFEIALLLDLGYLPDLQLCTDGLTEIEPDNTYALAPQSGFTPTYKDERGSNIFRGIDIQAIESATWDNDSLRAAKRFTRIALAPLVGEKPLKSRALFGEVK